MPSSSCLLWFEPQAVLVCGYFQIDCSPWIVIDVIYSLHKKSTGDRSMESKFIYVVPVPRHSPNYGTLPDRQCARGDLVLRLGCEITGVMSFVQLFFKRPAGAVDHPHALDGLAFAN